MSPLRGCVVLIVVPLLASGYLAGGQLPPTGEQAATVWGLAGWLQRGKLQGTALRPKELEALWTDLAGEDAARAYRAIGTLAAAPKQAVPFLAQRLRPLEPADARLLARLLADLDNDGFAVRERASAELEKLGWAAEPALRKAWDGTRSLEVRRRTEALLDKLQGSDLSPEDLRMLRAVEVLEAIGTRAARLAVEPLANGVPQAPLTREAKATLQRLARRAAPPP